VMRQAEAQDQEEEEEGLFPVGQQSFDIMTNESGAVSLETRVPAFVLSPSTAECCTRSPRLVHRR
jgi:hypothetical protein